MFETIVALATPPLKSALAIIRLSGDDCFDVVSPMFNKDLREITEKTILYGAIVDGDEKIDQVVLLAYKGPRSFTGEDSVEIICHGSMLIVNQIISLAIKHGARLATHGEFSSRAFFHNKIDLIQAESINDVINATTQESKKLSLLSLDGEVTKMVTPIRSKIADILSLIEVNIDFPEYEDIEIANKEKVLEYVDLINDKIINIKWSESQNH
jgi:tRNA modification GTPase